MDKSMKWKIAAAVAILLGVLFAAVAIYLIPGMYDLSVEEDFSYDDSVSGLPLTGYAPSAEEDYAQKAQLVFINMTWAEWEPEEGEYDIEGLEEKYQLDRWREAGKHAVLRFVCDRPGEESHMDIPEWLYERTGDGIFYDTEYGKGYCPDYSNEDFIAAHQAAMQALGSYFSQDTFLAYVELGSLGHWGEWHTLHEEGLPPMPDIETCWQYANHYSDSFLNVRFLMRRNYVIAADGNMGLYNDMVGHAGDTQEWLDWQKDGGYYELPEGELPYKPMEEVWNSAPVGGEFTGSLPMEQMLVQDLDQTLSLIEQSHMTFLGPHTPLEDEGVEEGREAVEALLGYRYWISHMSVDINYVQQTFEISLTWENSGSAPSYLEWPAMMYVYDKDGNRKYWESVDLSLPDLLPGASVTTVNSIPFNDLFRAGYSIGIGILDPLTELPAVELCMNKDYRDGVNIIYTYDGKEGVTF
ncbi:MAG TPA: DUF4832 domain-containing protein [Candidatus Eisenbergiella intestinipullorum]|nr:DUF4832 domain-containing protein [Candidatus Eisenbergiella intestinipullorum]